MNKTINVLIVFLFVFVSCSKDAYIIEEQTINKNESTSKTSSKSKSISLGILFADLQGQTEQLVTDGIIKNGVGQSIIVKLINIRKKLDKGQIEEALIKLNDLIIHLDGLVSDGAFPADVADDFISQINDIKCGILPFDGDGDGVLCDVDCDDTDSQLTDNCIFTVYNPITGKTWMDRNLGASQVATSSDDAASYGYLYQWGRGADGHQLRTSETTTTLSSTETPLHADFIIGNDATYDDWLNPENDNLWQGLNGINNPCPEGFRIPTATEWDAERASWSSQDPVGAFASQLKLPASGIRIRFQENVYVTAEGIEGNYWSSTTGNDHDSYFLVFYTGNANVPSDALVRNYGLRSSGMCVRCIKE